MSTYQGPGRNQVSSSDRALAILMHPATWGAMAALALNDLVLRQRWPSVLTGKLGDFAWLFCFPLVVAAAIALAAPRPVRRRHWLPAILAFAFVGGLFALAKTVPFWHTLVVGTASALFGFPASWRRDPGDLIALLALAPAWWLWFNVGRARPAKPAGWPYAWRFLGLLLIPLSGFLTMADAAAPRPIQGVTCVGADAGRLYAATSYGFFNSTDGGLTWTASSAEQASPVLFPTAEPAKSTPAGGGGVPITGTATITTSVLPTPTQYFSPGPCGKADAADPSHPNVLYRFQREHSVETSQDAGQTWEVLTAIPPLTGDEKEAYHKLHDRSGGFENKGAAVAAFEDRPFNLVVDPATGNAVFAMGLQGVLVRTTDGAWVWVAVGQTRPVDPPALPIP